MSKIVLLLLFCAISGYGINGHPNDPNVSPQRETKVVSTIVPTTSPNGTTLSSHQNQETVAPQTVPSRNVTNLVTSNTATAEPKSTISNANIQNKDTPVTKTQTVEEVTTSVPVDKSLPMSDNNSFKAVTPNVVTGSPISTVPSVTAHTTTANTTTTALPITTTTEAPIKPVPDPKAGNWILTKNNQTCIIVSVALQFHVSHTNKSSNMTTYEVFNLPDSANETTVTGNCGKLEQNITLSWNNTQNVTNSVNLHFIKNDTKHSYSLHHMEIVFLIPNKTAVTLADNTLSVSTSLSNSYRCLKRQNYTLTQSGTNDTMGYFLLSDLQFQAFKTDNSKDFGTVEDCKLDTPDIVPIAVGCALSGLIVIMLIAYLIGRKRSQGRGYTSM